MKLACSSLLLPEVPRQNGRSDSHAAGSIFFSSASLSPSSSFGTSASVTPPNQVPDPLPPYKMTFPA